MLSHIWRQVVSINSWHQDVLSVKYKKGYDHGRKVGTVHSRRGKKGLVHLRKPKKFGKRENCEKAGQNALAQTKLQLKKGVALKGLKLERKPYILNLLILKRRFYLKVVSKIDQQLQFFGKFTHIVVPSRH